MHTWQSQDACALSRHCEPCKQSSWSRVGTRRRKGLSSQAFPQGKWCGHQKSHLDHCCFMKKCQVPNHSWVDWWGWWEADGKSDGKWPKWGLNSGPQTLRSWSQRHNYYTTQPHTHILTHSHYLSTHTLLFLVHISCKTRNHKLSGQKHFKIIYQSISKSMAKNVAVVTIIL